MPRVILRRLVVVWGLLGYVLVPVGVVAWLIDAHLVRTGMFAAAVAALATLLHRNWRVGLVQVALFSVLGALAVTLSPYPIAGGLFMAACGFGLGISSRWGWNYSVFVMPILLITLLINPVAGLASESADRTHVVESIGLAVTTALVLFVAGVLTVLLCVPIVRRMNSLHEPAQLPHLSPVLAGYYSVVLSVCLGVATWWVLAYERVPDASWLLLTLVLLLQPVAQASTKKIVIRALGTLAGSTVAILIAAIPAPWMVGTLTWLITAAASVVVFDTSKRYWLWVVLWTPSIILLSSQSTNAVQVAEFRLSGTLIAALIAALFVILVNVLRPGYERRAEQKLQHERLSEDERGHDSPNEGGIGHT